MSKPAATNKNTARWRDLRPAQKLLTCMIALMMMLTTIVVAALVLALILAPAALIWWVFLR